MPHAAPKADAAVAATRDPLMWVLLQLAPRVEVLAVGSSRNRLIREMADLYGADHDRGREPGLRLAVRSANILFA